MHRNGSLPLITTLAFLSLVPRAPLAAQQADSSAVAAKVTSGVTAGGLTFPDGRTQQGASAIVRWHPRSGLSLALTPSFTRVVQPTSLGGGSRSGLSDLPVELAYDHELHMPMSLTLGGSLVATIPVGDTTSGLGSGRAGSTFSLGLGLEPVDNLSLHLGAGRPLSDYSTDGALGGSSSAWGDAEASYQVNDRVNASLGVDADFSADSGLAPARTLVAGMSFAVRGPLTLTVNGGRGVSGDAARWSVSLGLGTDFAAIGSLGSTSVVRRAVAALGGHSQTHGGWGRPTTPGSGHGKP